MHILLPVAYTDQPETRFNNTTVLIQHSKWWSFSLSTCSLPNKEIPNMDIHYTKCQNKLHHNSKNMRNELLVLRILVVLLLFFTLLSLISDIWIYVKQRMLQTQVKGILNTLRKHRQVSDTCEKLSCINKSVKLLKTTSL